MIFSLPKAEETLILNGYTPIKNELCTMDSTILAQKDRKDTNEPVELSVFDSSILRDGVLESLTDVKFQYGPVKEAGINGVQNEDLINMVLTRLRHFNAGDWSCRENTMAIEKLEEALLWLRKRNLRRVMNGTEGTSQK